MAENLRLNSEKKINHPYISLKIGTVNRLDPKPVYIEGKAYVFRSEDTEYDSEISSNIRYLIKDSLIRNINNVDLFDRKKYIIDFSLSENNLRKGKPSFMSFQVTLRQRNEVPFEMKRLKPLTEGMVTAIADDVSNFIRDNDYLINKKQKIAD